MQYKNVKMRNKTCFMAVIGICSYLCMPVVLMLIYEQKGYFRVGGEWLIPVFVIALAYFLYDIDWRKAQYLLLATGWLMITASWNILCEAFNKIKGVF